MSSLKLSRFAQKKLKDKEYVPCLTSFITGDGPTVGTIWWDHSEPRTQPRIVKSVQRVNNRKKELFVFFEDGTPIRLTDFMQHVEIGFFILIGVTPQPWSHTEI